MNTYLVAHTNDKGTNIGQARITAKSQQLAKDQFREQHPERVITTVGVEGAE